jgi:hypothetical protein
MARPFKKSKPLLPTDNLDLSDALVPDAEVRKRCEDACEQHIGSPQLRRRALDVMGRTRAWRLNAARVASGREMRRKLKVGAGVLKKFVAMEDRDGLAGAKLLDDLLQWLHSLDLNTILFLGGFCQNGNSAEVPFSQTRLGALRSVDDLKARLAARIRLLEAGTTKDATAQTPAPFDATPMLDHLNDLAGSIPRGPDGRPSDENLNWFIQELAAIWEMDRRKAFRWSYKDPQYGFVVDLCRAVAPEIDEPAIRTGIREAAKTARTRRQTPLIDPT